MAAFAIFSVAKQTLWKRVSTEDWVTNSAGIRLLANQVSLRALRDAGPFGFGPGTFQHIFPHYIRGLSDAIPGYWLHAHQDYLQTLIEWGWIGWLPFGFLIFGGVGTGFYHQNLRPAPQIANSSI